MTCKYFNFLFLFLAICTNINALAEDDIQIMGESCIGDARVFFKHLRADELIQATARLINKEIPNQNIITGLDRYFKLNPANVDHAELIKTVFANINKVSKKSTNANYRCDEENETSPCNDSNNAGTRMISIIGKKIFLCPGFFTRLSEVQKVGVILHQWFHAFARKEIARSKEKFCSSSGSHAADVLVRQADQYMQFIYFVGSNGSTLDCF